MRCYLFNKYCVLLKTILCDCIHDSYMFSVINQLDLYQHAGIYWTKKSKQIHLVGKYKRKHGRRKKELIKNQECLRGNKSKIKMSNLKKNLQFQEPPQQIHRLRQKTSSATNNKHQQAYLKVFKLGIPQFPCSSFQKPSSSQSKQQQL